MGRALLAFAAKNAPHPTKFATKVADLQIALVGWRLIMHNPPGNYCFNSDRAEIA
jgi:hypothetical protein